MKLFHRFQNSVSKPETETIALNPTLTELKRFFNQPVETLSTSMLNSATYYACMQIRCNAIAKLPIKLMQQTEDGTVENKTEHVSQVLKNVLTFTVRRTTLYGQLNFSGWNMGMHFGLFLHSVGRLQRCICWIAVIWRLWLITHVF